MAVMICGLEIADGLVQPDHALLHDVLVIRADQKIAARPGADKIFVFVQQVFQRFSVALLGQQSHVVVVHLQIFFVALIEGFRHACSLAAHSRAAAAAYIRIPAATEALSDSIAGFFMGIETT